MGRMKGFYFSLDALIASTVLLAAATMVMLYTPMPQTFEKPEELGMLHTASMQEAQDWNSSIEDGTVIENIYTTYFQDKSKAETICENYFDVSGTYALFLANQTERMKVCGDLQITEAESIKTESTLVPDKTVDQKFRGPYKAIMVVQD